MTEISDFNPRRNVMNTVDKLVDIVSSQRQELYNIRTKLESTETILRQTESQKADYKKALNKARERIEELTKEPDHEEQ
jgi:chromosome segregation ATPase